MAFLNEYKRRAVRRTTEYQVLMEDLVSLGIVADAKYNELIGRKRGTIDEHIVREEPVVAPRFGADEEDVQ